MLSVCGRSTSKNGSSWILRAFWQIGKYYPCCVLNLMLLVYCLSAITFLNIWMMLESLNGPWPCAKLVKCWNVVENLWPCEILFHLLISYKKTYHLNYCSTIIYCIVFNPKYDILFSDNVQCLIVTEAAPVIRSRTPSGRSCSDFKYLSVAIEMQNLVNFQTTVQNTSCGFY